MNKLITILFIIATISCNAPTTQNTNSAIDTTATQNVITDTVAASEMRSATTTFQIPDISSLLYTEAQAKFQYTNTPNVKKPMDTFWFNIQPSYKVNGQLEDVHESLEYMMVDINNKVPARKHYSWDYFTPTKTLVGHYLYVTDRNKFIVPQFQHDLDSVYSVVNKEFGFYVYSEQKNITGYYQKATIKKQ